MREFEALTKSPKRHKKFWQRILIDGPDKCWAWVGVRSRFGYGRYSFNGEYGAKQAHRVAFAWYHQREIEPGMHLLHSCDTPYCCNPTHMREGTNAENVLDRIARGKNTLGEENGQAKLTLEQVREIRRRHASGESGYSIRRAMNLPVADITVQRVISGRKWGRVL